MTSILINKPMQHCSRCKEALLPDSHGETHNALFVEMHGGYSDFIDICGGLDVPKFILCHDCAVKILDLLGEIDPSTVEEFKGSHPYHYTDKPCCKYSWTINKDRNII